jgi:hypothetical protein
MKPMASDANPDRPAPLRATSGAGFDFEDKVSAWLMVKLLVGEPVPHIGGRGTMIQAQVAALGWKIDDLLVTSLHEGVARQLALSCKGNIQVSAAGLPASFVSAAWAQWDHATRPLRLSTDHLTLVTAGRHADFDATWNEVKHACKGDDAALALSRIRQNAKQLRVFDSVRQKSDTELATEIETFELIKRLDVLPVELHAADGLREDEAIGKCAQLLVSGELAEAQELWECLLKLAKQARLAQGTLTLLEVWEQLRAKFALRGHPDYRGDWAILATYSADQRDRIETVLPNGHGLERAEASATLLESLGAPAITIVTGESGSGKSGLVKRLLDRDRPTAMQLWLGPEATTKVLSAVERGQAGLRHDLRDSLRATHARENVLVLDAIEHVELDNLPALAKLLSNVLASTPDWPSSWHVVVTAQPRVAPYLAAAFVGSDVRWLTVGPLSVPEVKHAVRASPTLSWLTSHDATIEALTSLKALAWVLGAGAGLVTSATTFTSHIAVVEAMWTFWTQDQVPSQGLLMRLGEREAGGERSFALSALNAGDQQALQAGRTTLPLRVDSSINHVRFEHDLAADWARFQRLKELSNDPQAWAAFASHPLWTNALRLLGQHLLRRPTPGGTAWDDAFKADTPHAGQVQGVLFDAMCLDPQAESFLSERADWLLEERGRRLDQMLTRFLHVATVPLQPIQASGGWLEFHAEAHRRAIVVGRWAPVLRFVVAQQDKLGEVLHTSLARLAHTWLTQTPVTLRDKAPTPFRQELTDIALGLVRTFQVHHGVRDIFEAEPDFYAAALAGVTDRTAEVSQLALELCGRRPVNADTAKRIQAIHAQRQAQLDRRLASDPVFAKNHAVARQMGRFGGIGKEKLPPWPIGASYPVDRDFRKACFKSGILEPLMRVAPAVAAEVLLALIVDDEPERDFDAGRNLHRERLGLQYPEDAFPAIFWKSPFWTFLHVAPDTAITALVQLAQFCTERWAEGGSSRRSRLTLNIAGTKRHFVGSGDVLSWSQASSPQTANLHCALDSLERWLVLRIDEGLDVSSTVAALLRDSASLAIVGLLINVGKHHPSLFEGPLSPLLSSAQLYSWDDFRVAHVEQNFSAHFVPSGEQLYELAKQWTLAPHRRRALIQVAIGLLLSRPAVADALHAATSAWVVPQDTRASLQLRITVEHLNSANYQVNADGSAVFALPADLVKEIDSWEASHQPVGLQLTMPHTCQQLLEANQPLVDTLAAELAAVLSTEAHEEAWVQQRSERAIAAVLTLLAPDWLSRHATVQAQVDAILTSALASLPSTADELSNGRHQTVLTGMDLVATALTRQWAATPSPDADKQMLRLLTSGDRLATQTTVATAYALRDKLGDRWWRLLQVGVLWSGLSMLAPRYGDPVTVERVWTRWWRRLQQFSLDAPASADAQDFQRVDRGCARLMRRRQLRAFAADASRRHPDTLAGACLDTQAMDDLFHWLLRGAGSGNLEANLALVSKLWALEVEHTRERMSDDERDLPPFSQFGYHLAEKLAALALDEGLSDPGPAWRPVLDLGPAGHCAIGHFVQALFLKLYHGADPARFEALWKALADYSLAANWNLPRLWFYGEQLQRAILGFGSEWALDKLPAGAAGRMQATFGIWAQSRLKREDNLANFSLFLSKSFGAPLRLDGLLWIQAALNDPESHIGFHRDACGDALIELILTLMQHDLAALRQSPDAKAALQEIVAALAATGRQDALALQDRLRAALMG